MKKTSAIDALQYDIQLLKNKQTDEWCLLKAEFLQSYESLKPINILKSTLKEANASPQITNNIMGGVAGLTTGLLTRALWPGASVDPIKILVSSILQAGASNVVTKNADAIRSLVANTVNFFWKKADTQI
jgi:hypothetical protein